MNKSAIIAAAVVSVVLIVCLVAVPSDADEDDVVTLNPGSDETNISNLIDDYTNNRPNLVLTINLDDSVEYVINAQNSAITKEGVYQGGVGFYGKSLTINGDPDGDGTSAKVMIMGSQMINTNSSTGASVVVENVELIPNNSGGAYSMLSFYYYLDASMTNVESEGVLVTLTSTDIPGSTISAHNCKFITTEDKKYDGYYALTLKGYCLVADTVIVTGYDRGINMELSKTGSPSAYTVGCILTDIGGKCALQFSEGTADMSVRMSGCEFSGCNAAVSIHESAKGVKELVALCNEFNSCGTDFLYSVKDSTTSSMTVLSMSNTFDGAATISPEDGTTNLPENALVTLDWYDENSTEYYIDSEDDLFAFAEVVNSGENFAGKRVVLNTDIDLTNDVWTPIGNGSRGDAILGDPISFAGEFVGNGHRITGLSSDGYVPSAGSLDGDEFLFGLFGYLSGKATISGLNFTNVDIDLPSSDANGPKGDSVGALAGYAHGTIEISGITVENGAIVGYDAIGGIIGRSYGESITISDCHNSADVRGTSSQSKSGGIIGIISNSEVETSASSVTGCTSTGDSTSQYAGGIVGLANSSMGNHVITDCSVTSADISGTILAGGIVARSTIGVSVSDCNVTSSSISGQTAGGIVGGNGGVTNTISIKNCHVSGTSDSPTNIEAVLNAGGIMGSSIAKQTSIEGCSITHTDVSATSTIDMSVAGAVLGRTSTSDGNTNDTTIADIVFDTVSLDAANGSFVYNERVLCGILEGVAVGYLSGNGEVTVSNVDDFGEYELIALAAFNGTITLDGCNASNDMEWMISGTEPSISLVSTTLASIQIDNDELVIFSDTDSKIGTIIAGAANGRYTDIEGAGIFSGDNRPTGTIIIGANQSLTVDMAYALPTTRVDESDGFREYSGKITGIDGTSFLRVLQSGEGEGFMTQGNYVWNAETKSWGAFVDTSEYAGDYYGKDETGRWFLAISIDPYGNGTAYKAYPNDPGNKPAGSEKESFVITQVSVGDTSDTLSANLVERTSQTAVLTFNKSPGSATYTLHTNYKSLVGTEDRTVLDYYRAAPSDDEWFEYSYAKEIGFTPYYLTDAVELGMGDVTISLPSGRYSLTENSVDFNGSSLTIRAAEGADVVMEGFTANGNDGASITLDGITFTSDFESKIKKQIGIGRFTNVTIQDCKSEGRSFSISTTQFQGSTTVEAGTVTLSGNTVTGSPGYAFTVKNQNVVMSGNTVSGCYSGINVQSVGDGSISITDNTFSGMTGTDGETTAIQLSSDVGGSVITITGNTIEDTTSAVTLYQSTSGTPQSFVFTENTISENENGILYLQDGESYASQISIDADGNLFVDDDGIGSSLPVTSSGGADVSSLVTCDTWYIDENMEYTNEDLTSDVRLTDGYDTPIVVDDMIIVMSASPGARISLDVTFSNGGRMVFDGTASSAVVTLSIEEMTAASGTVAMYDVSVSGASGSTYTITLPFEVPSMVDVRDVDVYHYPNATTRGDAMDVTQFAIADDSGHVTFSTPHNSLYGIVLVTTPVVPVTFIVDPPDAVVIVTQEGSSIQWNVREGDVLELAAGSYRVTSTCDGYDDYMGTLTVVGDETSLECRVEMQESGTDLPPFIPFPPQQGGDPIEVWPPEDGGSTTTGGNDGGADTLKVVACAAAAVIAAILIVVWASTYRRN